MGAPLALPGPTQGAALAGIRGTPLRCLQPCISPACMRCSESPRGAQSHYATDVPGEMCPAYTQAKPLSCLASPYLASPHPVRCSYMLATVAGLFCLHPEPHPLHRQRQQQRLTCTSPTTVHVCNRALRNAATGRNLPQSNSQLHNATGRAVRLSEQACSR